MIPTLLIAAMLTASTPAQDAKPERKSEPKLLLAVPLGVPVGKPARVTLRGLNLDAAAEVRWADPRLTAPIKVLTKGSASVPDKVEAARVGDTQVEVEVTLPAEAIATAGLVVRTPSGDSNALPLLVETDLPVVVEKEPNGGFKQAQVLESPGVVEGAIAQGQDVDVFRLPGKAGQKVTAAVLASRFGSALDPILTIHDEAGRQLGFSDDEDGRGDARLEVTLPRDGVYYLSLIDAHDTGSNLHVYRLLMTWK